MEKVKVSPLTGRGNPLGYIEKSSDLVRNQTCLQRGASTNYSSVCLQARQEANGKLVALLT
jgi:hypothetical protein